MSHDPEVCKPTLPSPKRSVRYPNAYVWFVFLAALDIILTYLILHPVLFPRGADMTESRGMETNALADWIIERWDVPGMVAFKFLLVVLVVVLCEIIGRRKEETGRRIAEWAVAITAIPVVIALIQMSLDLYFWFYPAR
jgi:type II secretory pathway component PulF